MLTHQIISAHPHVRGNTNDALIACIEQCFDCADACTSCADACLAEESVADLVQCIRLNLDCADVCGATAIVATRRAESNEDVIRAMLGACMTACELCAKECLLHAEHMEHCRLCSEACERCAEACRVALNSMGGAMGISGRHLDGKTDGAGRH